MCKGVLGLTKRKNSFVEGAFILIAANLITKVIGALFKIPLGNLLGAEGMGVFSVAYNVYTTLFVIATAGLPVAISKLVAECLATGRQEETGRVLRVSLAAFSLFGLAAAALLWLGADQLTAWVGNPMAALAVRAVAPSLLFVSVLAVIRGYYQGLSDMVPTAVSQVLEALGKLLVGYGAACLLLGKGFRPAGGRSRGHWRCHFWQRPVHRLPGGQMLERPAGRKGPGLPDAAPPHFGAHRLLRHPGDGGGLGDEPDQPDRYDHGDEPAARHRFFRQSGQ